MSSEGGAAAFRKLLLVAPRDLCLDADTEMYGNMELTLGRVAGETWLLRVLCVAFRLDVSILILFIKVISLSLKV